MVLWYESGRLVVQDHQSPNFLTFHFQYYFAYYADRKKDVLCLHKLCKKYTKHNSVHWNLASNADFFWQKILKGTKRKMSENLSDSYIKKLIWSVISYENLNYVTELKKMNDGNSTVTNKRTNDYGFTFIFM